MCLPPPSPAYLGFWPRSCQSRKLSNLVSKFDSIICYSCLIYNKLIQTMATRHRRANSDLYGLKTTKPMLNASMKSTQATHGNQNLQSYQTKSMTSKKSTCPETPLKKIDAHQMILDTYKLLKHFYQNEDVDYFMRVKKYLNGEWESQKKNFIEHLNKLMYIEEEMQKKNYQEIELEILSEWRKNPVLYCIRAFWYQFVGGTKISSISELTKKYNHFKDFIGQLAYLYFKRFFLSLGSGKQIQRALDKLTQRTSHLIITYTTTWCKICDKITIPLLKAKLGQNNLEKSLSFKLDLQSLGIKTIAVDYKSTKLQMPKTINSIDKFVMEYKILEKIKLLIQIRENMELEIRNRQEHLIKSGHLKQIRVLDKDDFVDCLLYCVVRGEVPLDMLGVSIKYFYYILGSDVNTVLSKFRCDPYLADLEAVFDFLCQYIQKHSQKQNVNLQNIQVPINLYKANIF